MTSLVARLRRLDACAISDALDRVGVTGVALGLSALSVPNRIAGKVITVQLDVADGRKSPRHLCTAAVDGADPESIIVVAHNGRTDVAGWGGILSLGASRRGVQGVVVDGACRDLDESRELGLAVYAKAAVPVTARGRIIETAWNEPVTIASVAVAPGDLVIADGSGVVFVPAARAEEVVALAETIVARERLMAEDVRAGKPVAEVMGTSYESMLTKDGR